MFIYARDVGHRSYLFPALTVVAAPDSEYGSSNDSTSFKLSGVSHGAKTGRQVRRADPTPLIAVRVFSLTSATNSNAEQTSGLDHIGDLGLCGACGASVVGEVVRDRLLLRAFGCRR
jgi:hypothetical protein